MVEASVERRQWGAPEHAEGLITRILARLEAERERWFYWVPVLLGVGIGLYFALPVEPPMAVAPLPLILALALRVAGPRQLGLVLLLDIFLIVGLGLVIAKLRAERVAAPVLGRALGPVVVKGHVELIEPRETRGERITIRVAALGALSRDELPRRVRLRTLSRTVGLRPGDGIRVRARLAPPAPPALPRGYDFARYAYFQGLGGVGYTVGRVEGDASLGPPPADLAAAAAIERFRRAIGVRITAALAGQTGAIANALITGERGGISEATNDAYRDSGLFHVLSISGLHMAVMGGAVFYAVRLALALIPTLVLAYPIKKWGAAAAITGSLGYLAISGYSFATVRSFIMISIMFVAILLDRPALALRNVALAALVILVLYPESVLDVGFQMSFAAVVALVSSYEAIREHGAERSRRGRGLVSKAALFLGGIVLSTLVASVAVAPFALYHFHKSQLYAVVANVLAIPVCNAIVMPGALATLVLMPLGLERPALIAMGLGIEAMTWVAQTVAAIPGAVARYPAIPDAALALMVAGGLWLALWQRRWRLAGLAAIAAGVALAPTVAKPDLLVGRDGRLVAVRADGERLSIVAGARSDFEVARWLEREGEDRDRKQLAVGADLRCDAIGCVGRIKGQLVAVPRHPAAIAEDCRSAAIVVLDVPRPRGCDRPRFVVDFFAVRAAGAHALYVDVDGTVRSETVAGTRGTRPWAPAVKWATGPTPERRGTGRAPGARERAATPSDQQGAENGMAARSADPTQAPPRTEAFVVPKGLVGATGPSGAETEDDDTRDDDTWAIPEAEAAATAR